jgi:L-threonylcarbamoyladenylate synthase
MLDSPRCGTKPAGANALRVITVNPTQPRQDRLEQAVRSLCDGGIVALPTETFYGLAADSSDPEALRAVNGIKRKPPGSAILLLVADRAQVDAVAGEVPPVVDRLAQAFWPGPLTLIVPASPDLPVEIGAGSGTVAVRVPGLALPRRLAAALGRPITGISANRHGEPPCRTAIEVSRAFPEGVDLILDGGSTTGGAPSTILDLSGSQPRVARVGVLPVSALRPFVDGL